MLDVDMVLDVDVVVLLTVELETLAPVVAELELDVVDEVVEANCELPDVLDDEEVDVVEVAVVDELEAYGPKVAIS